MGIGASGEAAGAVRRQRGGGGSGGNSFHGGFLMKEQRARVSRFRISWFEYLSRLSTGTVPSGLIPGPGG